MAHLKLLVFGPPRIERDNQPIDLNLRKAVALFVYLAVTKRSHSRDALATLLWPDANQREGRARLRRTLHRLRDALGDGVLAVSAGTIRLDPQVDLWVDSAAFLEQVAAGLPSPADDDELPQQRLDHLTAAVEIYADDFLAGFTLPDSLVFDEWQFFERERMRQTLAQVLECLIQIHEARRAFEVAIAYARRKLLLDPLDEAIHRRLMQLYAWSGQQAAALRQYWECVRILDEELGVPPDEETAALFTAIKAKRLPAPPTGALHDPAAPPAPAVQMSPPSVPPPLVDLVERAAVLPSDEYPVFVARQHELAQLDVFLDAALTGQPRVAFVVGEAGQGKTALLQAFARRAQESYPDLIVAGGNCNAYTGAGDPYLPFREILELLTGDVEARATGMLHRDHVRRLWQILPATAQALLETGSDLIDAFLPSQGLLARAGRVVPDGTSWLTHLKELVARRTIRAGEGTVQQRDLFEQYSKVVQSLARQAPLLLYLDDVQWVDQGSADLLFHLGRRLQGCRVLILGAYRPSEVALGYATPSEGQRERHPLARVINEFQREFGEVILDLSDTEGQAFVDAWLDNEPNQLDQSFRTMLYHQTGGHPLFTIELLRSMQERGDLVKDSAGRWVEQPDLDWTTVPARVEGAIGERISRLEPALQELLQVASVEGEEFTAEAIARVLHIDEQEVVRRCSRELDKTHLLVRSLGTRRDGSVRLSRYRFRHILIQRVVLKSVDHAEQVYLNEALGKALETLYGERAVEIAVPLARHFEAAQLSDKAAIYLDHAGDQARRSAALGEAARYYQAALGQWPVADRGGRATLLRKLGECQWVSGRLQDALQTFKSSFTLFEDLGDTQGAGAVQRLIGRMYWEQGDRARALQHYHQALAMLEQGPESVELARTVSSISQMHMLASEYDQAIVWGERALTLAERLGADDVKVHALNNVGVAYFWTGNPERGQAMLAESLRRAMDLELPHDACRAYLCLGESLRGLGRYEEARGTFEELHSYAKRVNVPLFAGSAQIELARLDWLAGRWKVALDRRHQIREWIEQGQSIGYLEVMSSTLFGWMYNDLGQAHVAYQILAKELPKARNWAELQMTGPHLGQVARALALQGLASEADAIAQEFLEYLTRTSHAHPHTMMPLLWVCTWLVDRSTPGALDTARGCLLRLEQAHAQIGGVETTATLSEAHGRVALNEKSLQQATEHFRHAVACWEVLDRPYDQARTLSGLGHALTEAGDLDQARATFDQALSLIETLAMQLDDPEIKAAFLNSPLAHEIRTARAAAAATPPNTLSVQSTTTTRPEQEQQVRFCTSSDGVRIAYATVGAGPPLIKVANWMSHLEFDWQSPVWRHWLTALSEHHTLVRYDERGCGLSDWEVDELSVDAFVQDLEAVVDALHLERFPLLGLSQGGPIAITYAVRHPDKVSHLLLYGTYALGRLNRGYSQEQLELGETLLRLIKLGWGQDNPAFRQFFTSLFMPEATAEQMRWFNDLQRVSTSPEMAVRLETTLFHIDVSDLAPQVTVPTLVLHARDDGIVPFEEGRRLAALIPHARFVALEGKNHILLENEPAWPRFLSEVHRFLEEEPVERNLVPKKSPADLPSSHS